MLILVTDGNQETTRDLLESYVTSRSVKYPRSDVISQRSVATKGIGNPGGYRFSNNREFEPK